MMPQTQTNTMTEPVIFSVMPVVPVSVPVRNSIVALPDSNPDVRLIRLTLAGDSEAFGKIVQKYQPKFLGMAVRILGNRPEAEDVLQDAFIEAYRHLVDFQNKSRFSTWLYSIVLNHIRNRLRRRKVLHWVPFETGSVAEDFKPLEIAESAVPMDVLLEQKLQIEEIQKIVASFPLQYQSIFILHYFNGMPLKDIAAQLDRPLGTVKAYLHRARKLLYRRLKCLR